MKMQDRLKLPAHVHNVFKKKLPHQRCITKCEYIPKKFVGIFYICVYKEFGQLAEANLSRFMSCLALYSWPIVFCATLPLSIHSIIMHCSGCKALMRPC